MNAESTSGETTKHVFRPGPGQYAYVLLLPALPIALGITTILYGFTIHEHDWANRIFFGLLAVAFGAVPAGWLLGMSIVVDDQSVSKLYLFGALRSSIPRRSLRAKVEEESSRGGSYTRVDFDSADDDRVGFSVYPSWVWRSSDVLQLRTIAAESDAWRASHPDRTVPPWQPSIGTYLAQAWSVTYLCMWGCIVPLTAAYLVWGGATALAAFALIELGFVLIAVLLVWSKRTAHRHLNDMVRAMVAAVALVGFIGQLPEIIVVGKFGNVKAIVAAGILESGAVLLALGLTLWQWRHEPHYFEPVASGQTPRPYALSGVAPVERVKANRIRRSDGLARPIGAHHHADLGWIAVLSAVAALATVTGIDNAYHFDSFTGVLDVAAGLLSFVPALAYWEFGDRLPKDRFASWPVRAVLMVITIAIPMSIWVALHGPPCPPNCGPGT